MDSKSLRNFAAAALVGVGVVTMQQPVAYADPPQFPDIDSYSPVNTQDYIVALPNPGRAPTQKVYFATPDGIFCAFAPSAVGITGSAGCSSTRLPGLAPMGPYTSIGTTNGPRATNSSPFVDGSIQGQKLATLPPFHSISVDGMICGVDDKGTTACKDPQGRGFLISPSWTGWLPKI